MNIAVIGSCELSLCFAQTLANNDIKVCAMVSLTKENYTNNSINLEDYARLNNINYFEAIDINSRESINFLKKFELDYVLSAWPKIIRRDLLGIPKYGVIGTHPTPLPRNKGRHPLHWMIAMGIAKSSFSFFKMDEGVDTGNILIQEAFDIGVNINNANENMIAAGKKGLNILIETLKRNPNIIGFKQLTNAGNYWRKRDFNDITIDPRMSARAIIRLVNSFSHPYPLVRLYIGINSYLNISMASIVEFDELPQDWINYEFGYIFAVKKNSINIRVDDSVLNLKVNNQDLNTQKLVEKKIHPPAFYFIKN